MDLVALGMNLGDERVDLNPSGEDLSAAPQDVKFFESIPVLWDLISLSGCGGSGFGCFTVGLDPGALGLFCVLKRNGSRCFGKESGFFPNGVGALRVDLFALRVERGAFGMELGALSGSGCSRKEF